MVTLCGALVAAVASVFNLVLQVRGKRDRFSVRLGSLTPQTDRETGFTVISLSDHPISLVDWGFVNADGTFWSLPLEWEIGTLQSDDFFSRGSRDLLNFGAVFESGITRDLPQFGAYAKSATQARPVIIFASSMSYWRRAFVRLRLLVHPEYLR